MHKGIRYLDLNGSPSHITVNDLSGFKVTTMGNRLEIGTTEMEWHGLFLQKISVTRSSGWYPENRESAMMLLYAVPCNTGFRILTRPQDLSGTVIQVASNQSTILDSG